MKKAVLFLILILILTISCHNRIGHKFYMVGDEGDIKLADQSSYYLENMTVGHDPQKDPMIPGENKVLILSRKGNDPEMLEINTGLITAVAEIEYRLYTDLSPNIDYDSLNIAGRSVCRIIGKYDRPVELVNYECTDGFLVIDTLKTKEFVGHISAKYFNPDKDSLIFKGNFKAKLKR